MGIEFTQQGDKLILKSTKNELRPSANPTVQKDLLPDVSQYMDQINKVREEPKRGGGGTGVTQQPASAGPMGESEVGGGGPSGTRALPPQDRAPGYEGNQPSSKR